MKSVGVIVFLAWSTLAWCEPIANFAKQDMDIVIRSLSDAGRVAEGADVAVPRQLASGVNVKVAHAAQKGVKVTFEMGTNESWAKIGTNLAYGGSAVTQVVATPSASTRIRYSLGENTCVTTSALTDTNAKHVGVAILHKSAKPTSTSTCSDYVILDLGNNVASGECGVTIVYGQFLTAASGKVKSFFRLGSHVGEGAVVGYGQGGSLPDSDTCGASNSYKVITLKEADADTFKTIDANKWNDAVRKSIHPEFEFTMAVDSNPLLVVHGVESDTSTPITVMCAGCTSSKSVSTDPSGVVISAANNVGLVTSVVVVLAALFYA